MSKKCPSCGTTVKTVATSAPSKARTGAERGAVAAAARQAVPLVTKNKTWASVDCCGEGPLSAKRMEFINREDTPKQAMSGGPDVLNKGEHIFSIYPRRTDQGRTIRSNQES
jgi:hypothetical protein